MAAQKVFIISPSARNTETEMGAPIKIVYIYICTDYKFSKKKDDRNAKRRKTEMDYEYELLSAGVGGYRSRTGTRRDTAKFAPAAHCRTHAFNRYTNSPWPLRNRPGDGTGGHGAVQRGPGVPFLRTGEEYAETGPAAIHSLSWPPVGYTRNKHDRVH